MPVNHRLRLGIYPVVAHVADNADDRERAHVAIHVAELDDFAERIFVGPLLARQRFADERHMGRIRAVALLKHASPQQRDAQGAEVASAGHSEARIADPFWILRHPLPFVEAGELLAGLKDQELTVVKFAREWKALDSAGFLHARHTLQLLDQLRI